MRRFVHTHAGRVGKAGRRYAPSFYEDGFISAAHEGAQAAVEHLPGKLLSADHLKLYELGYFAGGPILEIGRFCAKSTILLAMGVRDAGRDGVTITSIDYNDNRLARAEGNLRDFGVRDLVNIVQASSWDVIPHLRVEWDVVFVDGDHSYEGVQNDVRALHGRVRPGGVIAFHDYWDGRNDDPDRSAFGVRQAVEDLRDELGLAFRGGFGAIGLYEQT